MKCFIKCYPRPVGYENVIYLKRPADSTIEDNEQGYSWEIDEFKSIDDAVQFLLDCCKSAKENITVR